MLTAFSLAYLFNALAPETSMDGVNHGLGMVARYCREHGFRQFSPEAQPHLPQTVQMLFLVAYAFGAHSAASMELVGDISLGLMMPTCGTYNAPAKPHSTALNTHTNSLKPRGS